MALAAAHTRAGIADALATITPALSTPGRGRPPAAVLRAALYGARVQPRPGRQQPRPGATAALAGAQSHSLPLGALADPQVRRLALDTLTLRLSGTRAAAATITRPRRLAPAPEALQTRDDTPLNRAYARRSGWLGTHVGGAGRSEVQVQFLSPLCALLAQLVKAADS